METEKQTGIATLRHSYTRIASPPIPGDKCLNLIALLPLSSTEPPRHVRLNINSLLGEYTKLEFVNPQASRCHAQVIITLEVFAS